MNNLDDATQENAITHNPKWKTFSDHSLKVLIIGAPGKNQKKMYYLVK